MIDQMLRMSAAIFVVLLMNATSVRAAPPTSLYGKSVKLTWTDNWSLIDVATSRPSQSAAQNTLTIYVSDKGRIFHRRNMTDPNGSKVSETIGNTSRSVEEGHKSSIRGELQPFTAVNFAGRNLTAQRLTGTGSAAQVSVAFDEAFASCTLAVSHGSAGKNSVMLPPTSKAYLRIVSITASGMSCSVAPGNLLQ